MLFAPSRALARLAIVAAAALLAVGCSLAPDFYPQKGDSAPHHGVRRVHTLPVHGIDVSHWQGRIDWDRVRAAGTRFAFIKATEGGLHLDPRFHENWEGARRVGIPRGAYHFIFWCRDPVEQARWFIENVPNDPDMLPPVLDMEWNNHSRLCRRRVPREEALEKTRVILEMFHRHYGRLPIIYTDINFHRDVLEGEHFDATFWLRSVAAEPHERYRDRRWTFWQWTQTGTVPGIRGGVDRNAFYGTEREWREFLSTDCDPRDAARLNALGYCRNRGS